MAVGVTTPGGPCATDQIASAAESLGQKPQYLLWYQDFTSAPPMDELRAVQRAEATPVITWEPWTRADRGPGTIRRLMSGALDEYVHGWVAGLHEWQHPVYLRFAHEFNGDWYPWSPAGGTPADTYVAAWRRIHRTFTAHGATNVRWLWCPDAADAQRDPITDWYPGDEYVDCIGLDGYNWGTSGAGTVWREPAEIFGPALADAVLLADGRPVIIAEVGCAESGGNKADWITTLVHYLIRHTKVTGFVWFEHDKETDWRIASTPESALAMAEALRSSG